MSSAGSAANYVFNYRAGQFIVMAASANTITFDPHIVYAGTVSINADQGGNIDYDAAPTLSQPLQIAKADQTLVFSGLPAQAATGAPLTLSAATSQPGSADYNPAPSISDSVTVYSGKGYHSFIGVFPNPAHGTLHIRFSADCLITKVSMVDMMGNIVVGPLNMDSYSSDIPLNIAGLTPGYYILNIICIRSNNMAIQNIKILVE
jgi:hypothetical protein